MALKVKLKLSTAEPFFWIGFSPQGSRDGTRAAAMFSIRHPKAPGAQRSEIEFASANGFSFYADFNNLRLAWEEAYRPGSTKSPARKPDPLMLASAGEPDPPDGWEPDKRAPKNGWRRLYHLPVVLADGRRGAFEVSNFAGRVAIETMLKDVSGDPVDYGDAMPYFRCVGTYQRMTRAGGTVVPQFVLERWGKPDGTTATPAEPKVTRQRVLIADDDEGKDTPIAPEADPATARVAAMPVRTTRKTRGHGRPSLAVD